MSFTWDTIWDETLPQNPPDQAPPPQTVSNKQFRADFAAFADTTVYLNSTLTYWLCVSQQLNNPNAWKTLLVTGIELLAAHFMVLETQAMRTALNGGIPGLATGPIQSKAVDRVNIAYAVQMAQEDGAGSYNATIYGQRWWHLAQLVGAGGVQL